MAQTAPSSVPRIPGWRHHASGKVRELYLPETPHPAGDVVLFVATDRISAYDHVLAPEIPGKGIVLTQLSLWWFERLIDVVPTHVVSLDVPEQVAGRAMICRRLDMVPIECVARGYLTGSGLAEYRQSRTVCGIELPEGLVDGSRLEHPLFTPATKAEIGDHDENITYEQMAGRIGDDLATRLRELTLEVYGTARDIAAEAGIVLADTKFEFGLEPGVGPSGDVAAVVLADEVLTPDSSRFWPQETYEPGRSQPSFDKQYVRDWLRSDASGWDGQGPPPSLPEEVVQRTAERYVEAYTRLTGRPSPL